MFQPKDESKIQLLKQLIKATEQDKVVWDCDAKEIFSSRLGTVGFSLYEDLNVLHFTATSFKSPKWDVVVDVSAEYGSSDSTETGRLLNQLFNLVQLKLQAVADQEVEKMLELLK